MPVLKDSFLTGKERLEMATLPNIEAKKQYLTQALKIDPNYIVEFKPGELGLINPDDKDIIHPADPSRLEMADITEALPKAGVTVAQILGGVGGAMVGGLPGEMVGAGLAGAGAEASSEKLGQKHIQSKYGVNIGGLSAKEIAKEGAFGAGGALAGRVIGSGLKRLLSKQASKALDAAIPTSKMLSKKLEDSAMRALVEEPSLAKEMSPTIGRHAEDYTKQAADEIIKAKDGISKVQSKFYKEAGITDETRVPINTKLPEMTDIIKQHIDNAVTPASKRAGTVALNSLKEIGKRVGEDGAISFGQIKQIGSQLFDQSLRYTDETGRKTVEGKLFTDLYRNLADAKKSIPAIAQAGEKYKDLMDAEDILRNVFRLKGEHGETMMEKKIVRFYKDLGNQTFKEYIDDAANILKKHPESAELGNFGKAFKKAQIAINVEKADKTQATFGKGATLSKAAFDTGKKMVSPLSTAGKQITILGKLLNSGIIKPQNLLGDTIESSNPFFGEQITQVRAIRDVLDLGGHKAAKQVQKTITPSIQSLIRMQRENQ